MTSRRRSSRFFVLFAIVPLLVSVQARRAGADSYCDQECDREPGGCSGNSSDDCYATCETNRDRQLAGSGTPPPSSTTPPWEPDPPPPSAFGDDAGAALDASLD